MAEKKHGKLRRIEIEVADNGYKANVHREPPERNGKEAAMMYGEKPEETVHEYGESLMDHMHGLISEHEGKSSKNEPKRVAGANILARKGKEPEGAD